MPFLYPAIKIVFTGTPLGTRTPTNGFGDRYAAITPAMHIYGGVYWDRTSRARGAGFTVQCITIDASTPLLNLQVVPPVLSAPFTRHTSPGAGFGSLLGILGQCVYFLLGFCAPHCCTLTWFSNTSLTCCSLANTCKTCYRGWTRTTKCHGLQVRYFTFSCLRSDSTNSSTR